MVPVLDQFILSLRDSRLIPAEELVSLQKALQGSKTPHSVEDVAKMLVKNGRLTEYQATTIAQGRSQSLILGEYVLLSILGKGGMGIVFRARHRLMDREVALKTLSTVAIKPDTIQRFYREVKAAARLSHPNIVTAYDAGEQAGTHYLVMEYVHGRDLAAIVKEKGPLPLRQAIDYVQQAARGLEFAHKHGVVHRNVKPSNLLLDQEGVVKILDMGLARLSEDLAGTPEAMEITSTGQILGTVDYMSPEQAEDVRSADHRSDIYSLGCTLFFLLTRRPVYGGETIVRRILCHRSEPIPSLMEVRPDCPEALDALLQWMLAKQPEDRPQGMAEVIVALESCLAKPDAAPPLAVPTSDAPAPSRNWLEDLSEEPAGNTADSQVLETTAGSPPMEEVFAVSQFASKSGSTKGRPKQQTHRPAAKKTAPATPGRWSWKIVAAAIAAPVIVVAAVTALVLSQTDSGTAKKGSAGTAKLSGAPALPAGSTPDRPGQSASEEAWANAKSRPTAWSPSGSSPRQSTSTRPWPASSRISSSNSAATRRSAVSRPRRTRRSQNWRPRRETSATAAVQASPCGASTGPDDLRVGSLERPRQESDRGNRPGGKAGNAAGGEASGGFPSRRNAGRLSGIDQAASAGRGIRQGG